MMQHVKSDELLALEQYGSRKEKLAIECALNKQIICDILRQSKQSAGMFM